jgi:hypothetical protein
LRLLTTTQKLHFNNPNVPKLQATMFSNQFSFVLALISFTSALPTLESRAVTRGIVSLWTTSGARLNFVSPQQTIIGGFATTVNSNEALNVTAEENDTGIYALADVSSTYVGVGDFLGLHDLAGVTTAANIWYAHLMTVIHID